MRLHPNEVKGLIQAVEEYIDHHVAELRLYGSRTDFNRRGGDIDLLLILFEPEVSRELALKKHYLLARMKELIGDQKIDLKIIHQDDITQDPFLQVILPHSKLLKSWP